jgi:peptidoglycan hydrolase-like protein with peptidoglycan-binding domain
MTLWPNGTKTRPAYAASGAYGVPRPGGRKHAGTDFLGYPRAKAITSGTVTQAGWMNADAGYGVAIDVPGLEDGCTVTIVRMHLDSLNVRRGQVVGEGHDLGAVGDSGNAQGNCDHTEIRYWKGGKLVKTVDPVAWIAARVERSAGVPTAPAPAFPLPAGSYFGPRSGPAQSVSGYFSHRESLRAWQQRMKDRGWKIDPDGLYGDQTGDVAEAFQREKGLDADRKIGPQTWAAAWTAPVT